MHCAGIGPLFQIRFYRAQQYCRFGLARTPGFASKGGVKFWGKLQVQLLSFRIHQYYSITVGDGNYCVTS